ncbi:DNA-deoxyinosine glycosylase [Thiomonas bhubaneswarensis]|uniref:G/U mismatch-specific uracil-DNA glycosylase n=1 Tax=Thiomonas bhubaneswarensis TaxID=339866 RepID=A0A0K6I2L6_9BURK|nr:DNA-deoxyinosine glycosylase [Thiomonas bhubaneswarensis]CUA97326.1 G/U mismatch-specific uracil-DNA glycosylase [Thiomonas bhubaneswarensis]
MVRSLRNESVDATLLRGLAPVIRADCRLLVLGSFPSVASLRAQQYYAHPRNQFWPIVGDLLGLDLPSLPYAERVEAVLQRGLGIWDVYAHCRREGSLDSAITDELPNDLAGLVAGLAMLRLIAHNGGESARAMRLTRSLGPQVCRLPSTSPANASWSLERKRAAWREAFVAAQLING